MRSTGHFVQFFNDDQHRMEAMAGFLREGLEAGCTCVLVATPEHRGGVAQRLKSAGIDAASLAASYQYIELDARDSLASFMNGSQCDPQRFHPMFDTFMRQVSARGQPVWASGEMVNLLMSDGLIQAALELEELWNELSRHHNFTMFCGYSQESLFHRGSERVLAQICAAHSHVFDARSDLRI
jgi:MEDS: MEthanogen/methylotroph, DcmR Sensory domain